MTNLTSSQTPSEWGYGLVVRLLSAVWVFAIMAATLAILPADHKMGPLEQWIYFGPGFLIAFGVPWWVKRLAREGIRQASADVALGFRAFGWGIYAVVGAIVAFFWWSVSPDTLGLVAFMLFLLIFTNIDL